jgi:hypothetical protein
VTGGLAVGDFGTYHCVSGTRRCSAVTDFVDR